MFRTASRVVARRPATFTTTRQGARFLSTAPPHLKSRSWRSSAVRWGVAVAGVYYYNTSTLFAEEPPAALHQPGNEAETSLPTLDSYTPSSRKKEAVASTAIAEAEGQTAEELEEDAAGEGAFNEETGEINWDCPCLGGMAYGPCGPEFREAFSCFVYSKEEPKGMECIDKFKGMQDCFRLHPELYQAELEGDEEDDALYEEGAQVAVAQPGDAPGVAAAVREAENKAGGEVAQAAEELRPTESAAPAKAAERADRTDEFSEALAEIEGNSVPRASHDARGASPKN